MKLEFVSDFLRYTNSPLVLVKPNGDIVSFSPEFTRLISHNIPYEKNLLEMLLSAGEVSIELFEMYKEKFIEKEKFPLTYHIKNKLKTKIEYLHSFNLDGNEYILIKIDQENSQNEQFLDLIINSENLFIYSKTASLIYSSENEVVISLNEAAKKIRNIYFQKSDTVIEEFENHVKKLVDRAKVGGIAEETIEISVNSSVLNFELYASLIVDGYYQVNIKDISLQKKSERLLDMEKQRVLNLSTVVPGVIFEYVFANNKFRFDFISNNIKDILGFTADSIINDPEILFSRIDKLQRAKLHHYFTSDKFSNEKSNNEFKIKDINDDQKYITIDWHGIKEDEDTYRGSGYISDVTEKKKYQLIKDRGERIKYLKEYFSLIMLKSDKVDMIYFNLAKTIVNKLSLENCIFYTFDINKNQYQYGASYVNQLLLTVSQDYEDLPNVSPRIFNDVSNSFSYSLRTDLNKSILYEVDKVKSELAIPIIFEGEILGLIYTSSNNNSMFSEEIIEVLENVALSLSWRITQANRQKIDNIYRSSLNTIFSKGKIFEFKYYYQNQNLSNDSLDNFISLLEIDDRQERLEIFQNKSRVFDYFDGDDLSVLLNSINIKDDNLKDKTFKLKSFKNNNKYIKVSVTNISKNKFGIEKVFGTVQDVTEIVELKNQNEEYKRLLSSMNAKFN